jgi:hypothetical protein
MESTYVITFLRAPNWKVVLMATMLMLKFSHSLIAAIMHESTQYKQFAPPVTLK